MLVTVGGAGGLVQNQLAIADDLDLVLCARVSAGAFCDTSEEAGVLRFVGFLRLMEDNPTRVLVKLIDETEDLSGLVFAGKYNPCVAAVPSPRFRSQPPSPVHSPLDSTTSMASVSSRFLFDDDNVLRIKTKNYTSIPQQQQQHPQVLPTDVANDHMAMLTCKLSGRVFTEPVLLSCCGETINNSAYATMKSCPFCQSMSPSAMPNRAIQNILRVVAADPLH